MKCAAEQRVVIGNQDFVCGHFSNDPVFYGRPDAISPHQSNSRLQPECCNQQGTFNANKLDKTAFQTLAAP
jgi:hypothetical protein